MVKLFEYLSESPRQTRKLGELLASRHLKWKRRKKALVFGLRGDLGGGKTTFLQGFAKGLGIKEKILSPTFVILKRFKLSNCTIAQFSNFYHIDCYRIRKPKEILELGFKEIISSPQNIVAVEWAERIKKIMPRGNISIEFSFINEKKRKIEVFR
jgi:tRNA threonylcarbamoyladenosine biosynthesis protein TsaE